jgi:1-deoxy-D-xylulose-5-phosphate reductoisomerase
MGALSFSEPDFRKFPCLALAYEAARQGGAAPCALNAANEVAVEAFLDGRLAYGAIPKIIERIITRQEYPKRDVTLDKIFETDRITRQTANRLVAAYVNRRTF